MRPSSDAPAYSRLVKAGVLIADLLVVALAALVTYQGLDRQQDGARTDALNLARFLEAGLAATFDRIDLTLRTVEEEHRRQSDAGRVDAPSLEAFLARHRDRTPDVLSLRISGADGVPRFNAPHVDESLSLADREYFTAQRDDPAAGLYVSRPFRGRIIRVDLVVASRRLSTPSGAFAGVVSASIGLDRLAALFAGAELGAHGVVEIRWRDGTLVTGKGPEPLRFGDARFPPALLDLASTPRSDVTRVATSPVDGLRRTYAVRKLRDYPLVVVVGICLDDDLRSWRRSAAVVWLLATCFVFLTVAVTWYGTPAWQRAQVEQLLEERTEHLRESEERFRIAFQTSPDSINLTRLSDGAYVAVNEGFLRMTGYTEQEVVGRRSAADLGIWVDPGDRQRLVEAVRRDGYLENLEARFRSKDGRIIVGLMSARRLQLRGEPLLLSITRDVSAWKAAEAERDRLQLQVEQAQRLESVGRLAGGVAHDFNNLLTVILGCLESLREAMAHGGADDDAREDVEQIAAAAGRARDLTRQLLAFARKQVIAPVPLDLGGVVRDGERLLQRIVGEDVALTVTVEDGLGPVLADPAQLEQVLLNLVVNARDAMPSGGTLTISARNAGQDTPIDPQTGARRQGEWVRLSVSDSGTGMTPDVQAHLFEPFFTTKAGARGTGLGLATVHGIVAQSGGAIEVETAPGQGTTFHVFLPRTGARAEVTRPAPRTPPPAALTARPGETLLVVEDDPLVRKITVRALEGAGYEVLVAATGAEAVALAASHAGRLDLVVSDVVMPGLPGPQTMAELRRTRPALRALFVSGYPRDAIAQRGILDLGVALLQKPFTAATLLERVRVLLDAEEPAPGRTGGEAA